MNDYLAGPFAEAVGWAILHLLWQGVVVAGILAAALALLARRSANARYVASCTALASLLILGIATAWRAYEPFEAASVNLQQRMPEIAAPAFSDAGTAITIFGWIRMHLPNIVFFWMIGVALLSARLLVSWIRAQQLAHRATQSRSEWTRVVARLAEALQLRRAVRVLESAAVEVPAVVGWLRPVILVPASALVGLSPQQLEMVLAHELAHIRRNDFLVNLLQAVVETLMFYHPAVWWMSRRVRIERENCCDDLAVAVCGNALQYARALTRLEELRASAPAAAVASNGGSLLDRIRRIAAPRDVAGISSRWAAAVATVTFVILVLVAPSLPATTNPDDEGAPPAPPTPVVAAVPEVDVVATPAPEAPEPPEPRTPRTPRPPRAFRPAPLIAPAPLVTPAPPGVPVPAPRAMVAPLPTPMPHLAPMPPMQPVPPTPMAVADFGPDAFDFDLFEGDEDPQEGRPDSEKLSVDELVSLRVMGVTPEYVRDIRAVFPEARLRSMTSMKAMGVTPEYIRDLKAAGVTIKTARDATTLRAVNVTPQFVKQLADAGYTNLTPKDLARLAAAGVNADFIRDMAKYRKK